MEWGLSSAACVLNGTTPPHSYSNEMEVVGSVEALLYSLRHMEVVVGGEGGREGERKEISSHVQKIYSFLLCHLRHGMKLDDMR